MADMRKLVNINERKKLYDGNKCKYDEWSKRLRYDAFWLDSLYRISNLNGLWYCRPYEVFTKMNPEKILLVIAALIVIYIVVNYIIYYVQKFILNKGAYFIWFIPGITAGLAITLFLLYFLAEYAKLGCGLHRYFAYYGFWLLGFVVPSYIFTKKLISNPPKKHLPFSVWTLTSILILFALFFLSKYII